MSHMCVIDLMGARAREFLRFLLANDVGKLTIPGQALYSCMLLPAGGVIDDLIAYFMTESWFRLVVNAGYAPARISPGYASTRRRSPSPCASAPISRCSRSRAPARSSRQRRLLSARTRAQALEIPRFSALALDSWLLARTGYTGEDGFEIMLPAQEAAETWEALLAQGITPAGLGARDTLRLEAGMNLYGNDMDESHHPLESGLGWTVAFDPAGPRLHRS